jgi:hypothetical protein
MKSCSITLILSSAILLTSAAEHAQGQALNKCTSGSAMESDGCLISQRDKEATKNKELIKKIKKKRPDVAGDLDRVALMEKTYRKEYCTLIGALEDGEPQWRGVWALHCEVEELHRFNHSLANYSK